MTTVVAFIIIFHEFVSLEAVTVFFEKSEVIPLTEERLHQLDAVAIPTNAVSGAGSSSSTVFAKLQFVDNLNPWFLIWIWTSIWIFVNKHLCTISTFFFSTRMVNPSNTTHELTLEVLNHIPTPRLKMSAAGKWWRLCESRKKSSVAARQVTYDLKTEG